MSLLKDDYKWVLKQQIPNIQSLNKKSIGSYTEKGSAQLLLAYAK